MESQAKKLEDQKRREEDIRRQIAALQAQLPSSPVARPPSPPNLSKRPREITLAPATPSPKKKQKTHETRQPPPVQLFPTRQPVSKPPPLVPTRPAPSNLLSRLAQHKTSNPDDDDGDVPIARSTSLTDKPAEPSTSTALKPTRDDNLAIIEDFEPGPYDHKPPFDDPNFDKLEPHSGIRLSSRSLPHEDLQEHMTGRYYLSPSRLYSCVRLTPDKHGYDVPVAGDWLTIAVVAERGPLSYTRAPVPLEPDDPKSKGKQKAPPKPSGKKYIVFKLVDLGSRARSASSATGGKAVVRGDACLSLFLFESDRFDTVTAAGSSRSKKVYKGGSGGAFESLSKLKERDVIVIMNPKIMKPNQGAARNSQNNMLGLTPESAESITILGRASDLGLCPATKRDGSTCGSWFDKRVSQACDWHIQEAVQRQRASRPEFSIGTTGMSTSTKKRKPAYDPARQWGLQPEANNSATYVLSGHIARGSGSLPGELAETMGREAQAKVQRKLAKDDDKALKALLDRDKDGMKAVMTAREFMSKQDAKSDTKAKSDKEKEKKKADEVLTAQTSKTTKNSFNPEMLKSLGFDPTLKPGQKRENPDAKTQEKLDRLSVVQSSRRTISLGRRAVSKTTQAIATEKEDAKEDADEPMVDLDD